ncbi:hypothetical protein MRX96_049192 [Rhipicephalus microplus]
MAYMSVLCSHLLGLPEDQLQRLDDECGLPLPKIRGKSIQNAVKKIRVHVTNMPTLRRHLETVAHINCFLVEQGARQPWTLYRIPERGGPCPPCGWCPGFLCASWNGMLDQDDANFHVDLFDDLGRAS